MFALATLAPLATGVALSQTQERTAREHALRDQRDLAMTVASDVRTFIDHARETARTITNANEFWDGSDADRDRILSAFARANDSLFGLLYFTPDLKEHGASMVLTDGTRRDMSPRPEAQTAVTTGQLVVSSAIVQARMTGGRFISVVVPMYRPASATPTGYLSVSLTADAIPQLWATTRLPSGVNVLLADTHQGAVLASSNAAPGQVSDTLDADDLSAIARGETTYTFKGPQGRAELRAWAPVADTSWVTLVDTPAETVVGSIHNAALQQVVVSTVVTLCAFLLLFVRWRRLLVKVDALRAAIAHWELGHWKHRVELPGDDELVLLSRAFDKMADRLDETAAERHAAMRALAESDAREAALRLRDQFLATASHDLKNPLTSIKILAQLHSRRVAAAGATPALVEDLAQIDSLATRMVRMIDELQATVRGDPTELDDASVVSTDLVSLARETVLAHQLTTNQHALIFQADHPELVVAWQPDELKRVLDNLLGNAIKYSPAGGDIHLTITEERHNGSRRAVLRVSDQGVGIPAGDLDRVFEPYARAANVIDRFEGSGLGLASLRQLVDRHQGTVEVASQEGLGSTFTIRLPRLGY